MPSKRTFDLPDSLRPRSIQESVDIWPPSAPLPQADVIVITWTSDEAEGLSRVLAPDLKEKRADNPPPEGGRDRRPQDLWFTYCRDMYLYWPTLRLHRLIQKEDISSRGSPSLDPERPGSDDWGQGVLGSFVRTRIGDVTVLLFRSQLHLNTDGRALPLPNLVRQIIAETRPLLVLSAGTAGGVSPDDRLGDVVVSNAAAFHLGSEFEDAAFNHTQYASAWTPSTRYQSVAETKQNMPLVYEMPLTGPTPHYAAVMPRDGVPPSPPPGRDHCLMRIASLPILTTDFFEFGTTVNGLDKIGSAVEMGDAAVAMTCDQAGVPFGFVRNVSDPVINGDMDYPIQALFASSTYLDVGVNTSMNGAVAIWALLAAEDRDRLTALAGSRAKVSVIEVPTGVQATPTPDSRPGTIEWGGDPAPHPLPPPAPSAAVNVLKTYASLGSRETFDPLPQADVAVLSWDAVTWQAMQDVFCGGIKEKWENEWVVDIRGFPEMEHQRWLRRLLQKEEGETILPLRQRNGDGCGRFRLVQIGARDLLLYDARASLLHDGSSTPMTRLLERLSEECKPSLMLSLGLGHATREDLVPGSVVVSNRACFVLTGELDGEADNGRSFGSRWVPQAPALAKAASRLRSRPWPALLAPSSSFPEVPAAGYRPPDPAPSVVVSPAMITAPRRVSMGFFAVPLLLTATPREKLDQLGWLVEPGDAVMARHCQVHQLDCGFIRGVSMPLLTARNERERAAWARYLHGYFGEIAAFNAVMTACTILS
jgi:nucleoside phosphorylase